MKSISMLFLFALSAVIINPNEVILRPMQEGCYRSNGIEVCMKIETVSDDDPRVVEAKQKKEGVEK